MKKFQQINLLIFFNGLLIIDFLPIEPTKIFSKDLNKIYSIEKNINSAPYESVGIQKSIDIAAVSLVSKNEVIGDLKANGNSLFSLLAFEQKDLGEEFFVEINSDKQYRDNDVFFAEGNAIIYLSNATLSGEVVKYDLNKKILTVIGNVIFKKGEQYFEASELTYKKIQDILMMFMDC